MPHNFSRPASYISENAEIGFNIYKGNPYMSVDIEGDDVEDFYDDIFNFDENKTETDETKDERKILKNGGYNIEENTNLVKQLKNNDLISSYTFLIKYSNKGDEKGEIIIGGLPHEYDQRHFSEDFYVYDYVPMQGNPPYNWHTIMDKITYDIDNIAQNNTYYRHVSFSLDFGFIVASYTFRKYFNEHFFNQYKDLCQEVILDNYIGIYCQEEVIKNFKNLSFYLSKKYNSQNNNVKLEFDYKDLFIKSKDNPKIYYFQIVFTEYSNKWILGRPLFKKYPTVFDQEKKIFGFYTQTDEYSTEQSSSKSSNSENNRKLPWSIIIIIFLIICVIVLSVILYKVIPLIRRKKKANELDEDFDYEPQDNKNESNGLGNEENKIIND